MDSRHVKNGIVALEKYLSSHSCVRCGGSEDISVRLKRYPYRSPALSVWGGTNQGTIHKRIEAVCAACVYGEISEYSAIWDCGTPFEHCQYFNCVLDIAGRGFCTNHRLTVLKWIGLSTRPMRSRGEGSTTREGYVRIYDPIYGKARPEHRMVMEKHLDRPLSEEENVHHINGVKNDNRLENLELWASSQPSGQRVSDLYNWATELVQKYEKEIENGKITRSS